MDVAQESYDPWTFVEESSAQDILAGVGRAVGSVSPELGEIFRYMQDNELYDIQSGEDGQDRMDNNYTVGLQAMATYLFSSTETIHLRGLPVPDS